VQRAGSREEGWGGSRGAEGLAPPVRPRLRSKHRPFAASAGVGGARASLRAERPGAGLSEPQGEWGGSGVRGRQEGREPSRRAKASTISLIG